MQDFITIRNANNPKILLPECIIGYIPTTIRMNKMKGKAICL